MASTLGAVFDQGYSLKGTFVFSWFYICELIIFGLFIIFYNLYFHRVIGTLISIFLRWYFWHNYRSFINIQSIHLSLLGCRLFFRNVQYIGKDAAFNIRQGHITWRYWLRNTRLVGLSCSGSNKLKNELLPCKLHISIDGLEWFIYNNSGAYDNLFTEFKESLKRKNKANKGMKDNKNEFNENDYDNDSSFATSSSSSANSNFNLHSKPSSRNNRFNTSSNNFKSFPKKSETDILDESKNEFDDFDNLNTETSLLLRILPISIFCTKTAFVIGNIYTPTLLIFNSSSSEGIIDAQTAQSKLDAYRSLKSVVIKDAHLMIKPNIDYFKNTAQLAQLKRKLKLKSKRTIWDVFINLISSGKSPNLDDQIDQQWKGLSRYLDDDQDNISADSDQYAKATNVMDCERMNVSLFYDFPSVVPEKVEKTSPFNGPDIGNSGAAPQWGVDIVLFDSIIRYGPWADRQRASFQSFFFPRNYVDYVPLKRLFPGDMRIHTQFQIFCEFRGTTTVRVPLKEASKDELIRAGVIKLDPNEIRSYGWLSLSFSEYSTISYAMDLSVTEQGSGSKFTVSLKDAEVRSSVNHGLLLRSDNFNINCAMPINLKWNSLQKWTFDFYFSNMEIFLLREHVSLFSDLATDFNSEKVVQYNTFVPFNYKLNVSIDSYSIYLTVNDLNVIDNPTSMDDNTFLLLSGDSLTMNGMLPSEHIRTLTNEFHFKINSPVLRISLHAASWNTQESFMKSPDIGLINNFSIKSTYTYAALPIPNQTDTFLIDVKGERVAIIVYGFFVRYFIKVKENYFGDFVHFRTLQEFIANPEAGVANIEPMPAPVNVPISDVIVNLNFERGCILLPANIYNVRRHIRLNMAFFQMDVRNTNFYMDLMCNISPIHASYEDTEEVNLFKADLFAHMEEPDMFIDGIDIHGHRMFGVPPSEPAFICNWDIDLGDILIESSIDLLSALGDCVNCFKYNIMDVENALHTDEVVLNDLNFLRINVGTIRLLIREGDFGIKVTVDPIMFSRNDWSTDRYNLRMNIKTAYLIAEVIKFSNDNDATITDVVFKYESCLKVSNFMRQSHFNDIHRSQQETISLHDAPLCRAEFLVHPKFRKYDDGKYSTYVNPGDYPVPALIPPLTYQSAGWLHEYTNELSSDSSIHPLNRNMSSFSKLSAKPSFTEESEGFLSDYLPNKANDLFSLNNDSGSTFMTKVNSSGYSQYEKQFMLTSNYRSENFFDSMSPDVEYDDFIIDLGEKAFLTLSSGIFDAILTFKSTNIDVETMLDRLNIDTYKYLFSRTEAYKKCMRSRIVVAKIFVNYIEKFDSLNLNMAEHRGSDSAILSIELNGLSIMNRKEIHKEKMNGLEEVLVELSSNKTTSISNILSQIHVNINSAFIHTFIGKESQIYDYIVHSDCKSPFNLSLEGVEVSSMKHTEDFFLVKTKTTGLVINHKDFIWVIFFFIKIMCSISDFNEKRIQLERKAENKIQGLIYNLTVAAHACSITSDPPALTKPAVVLRSSKHMIRLYQSWKLMVRLRHIWKSLPKTVSQDFAFQMKKKSWWYLPENIFEMMRETVEQWRSWDTPDPIRSYLLLYVFNKAEAEGDNLHEIIIKRVKFDFENILLRLPNEHVDDYIKFEYLIISGIVKSPSKKEITEKESKNSIVISLHCSNILCHMSWNLQNLIDIYEEYNQIQLIHQFENFSYKRKMDSDIPADKLNENTSKKNFGFEIQVISMIDSVFTVFESENLTFQASFNNGESSFIGNFGITSNQNNKSKYMSLTHFFRSFEVDIEGNSMTNRAKYATFGLQKATFSITVSPQYENMSVHLELGNFIFDIFENIASLSDLFILLAKTEIPKVQSLMNKIETISNNDFKNNFDSKIDSNVDCKAKPKVLFIFNLERYRLSFLPLRRVYYSITGSDLKFTIMPFSKTTYLLDFKLANQIHDMNFHKGERKISLYSILIPLISVTFKLTLQKGPIIINSNAYLSKISFEVVSVYEVLKFLTSPVTYEDYHEMMNKMERMNELFVELAPSKNIAETPISSLNRNELDKKQNVLFAGKLCVEKVSFSASASGTQLESVIEKIVTSFSNLDSSSTPKYKFPKFSTGAENFKIYLSAFDLFDKKVCIFDSHFNMNGSMYYSEKDGKVKTQINIVSNFIRGFLSPRCIAVLTRLLVSSGLKTFTSLPKSKKETKPLTDSQKKQKLGNTISESTKSLIFNIEISNVCLGWMPEKYSIRTGLSCFLIGLDSVNFLSKGNEIITMMILNAYMKFSEGNIDNYYDTHNASHCSALLPKVNVSILSIEDDDEQKRLAIKIDGDKVNLIVRPILVTFLNAILKSINDSTEYINLSGLNFTSGSSFNKAQSNSNSAMDKVKKIMNLYVNASFAGSTVDLYDGAVDKAHYDLANIRHVEDSLSPVATLKVPGVRFKANYLQRIGLSPSFSAEIDILPSSNTMYPRMIPVIKKIVHGLREVFTDKKGGNNSNWNSNWNTSTDDSLLSSNTTEFLNKWNIDLGLRIFKQEITLSCEPRARVATTLSFGYYMSVNTCESLTRGRYFTISANLHDIVASLQHVYSRETSGLVHISDIYCSAIETKGLKDGQFSDFAIVCAIENVLVELNVKQLNDLRLFRDIWTINDKKNGTKNTNFSKNGDGNGNGNGSAFLMEKYKAVSVKRAIPLDIYLFILNLRITSDLGQSIGKVTISSDNFSMSSTKTSEWSRELHIIFEEVSILSRGRCDGFLRFNKPVVTTSIQWTKTNDGEQGYELETPLVRASFMIDCVKARVTFDYHCICIMKFSKLSFGFFNQRRTGRQTKERLIAAGGCEAIEICLSVLSASAFINLFNTLKRIGDNFNSSYALPLRHSKSRNNNVNNGDDNGMNGSEGNRGLPEGGWVGFLLDTGLDVEIKKVVVQIYPATLMDSTVFRIEIVKAILQFNGFYDNDSRLANKLTMKLLELHVSLASISRRNTKIGELSVDEYIKESSEASGGTILKSPLFEVQMDTWQDNIDGNLSNIVEYVFRSSFGGNVDVRWNLGPINFIREMWTSLLRTLPSRSVGGFKMEVKNGMKDSKDTSNGNDNKNKENFGGISGKYEYVALSPPVIDQVRLRDMGEATPPLEWIGINRKRLPNLTHEIVIVMLQKTSERVSKAYFRVLGKVA